MLIQARNIGTGKNVNTQDRPFVMFGLCLQDNKYRWSSLVKEEVSHQAEEPPCPQHILSAHFVPPGGLCRSVLAPCSHLPVDSMLSIIAIKGLLFMFALILMLYYFYVCKLNSSNSISQDLTETVAAKAKKNILLIHNVL